MALQMYKVLSNGVKIAIFFKSQNQSALLMAMPLDPYSFWGLYPQTSVCNMNANFSFGLKPILLP